VWRIWVAALFWGLNWPAVKILLGGVPPWTLRTLGLGIGAVLLALLTMLSGRSLRVPRGDFGALIVASLLNVTGFNICAVFAQLSMPASQAAILTFTMPFWATLLGFAVLGERIDGLRAASLLLGAAGIALLVLPFLPALQADGVPMGLVWVLGAAISWAAGTVYTKARPIAADALAVTTWQVAVGALVCAAGLALFETPAFDMRDPRVLWAFAYHVALPQCLAYALWFSLIRHVTSATAALGTLLVPVFGVTGAMVILGERPAVLDLAGFALMLAAVVLDQIVRAARGKA